MVDINLFMVGIEDLDRKIKVINRVFDLLNEVIKRNKNIAWPDTMRDCPVITCGKISFKILDPRIFQTPIWYKFGYVAPEDPEDWDDEWSDSETVFIISAEQTLIVYELLPEIIETINREKPELQLAAAFDFFVQHAKTLKLVQHPNPLSGMRRSWQ